MFSIITLKSLKYSARKENNMNGDKLLNNETNMLVGNINKMCLTDKLEELEKMYEFAKRRLDLIFEYKKYILENEEEENKTK